KQRGKKEPGRGSAADRAGVGQQLPLTNDVKVSDLTRAVGHKRTLIEPLIPVSKRTKMFKPQRLI
ncbi:hypothetical protein AMECASPLE_016625, partial [Ameca splendens]